MPRLKLQDCFGKVKSALPHKLPGSVERYIVAETKRRLDTGTANELATSLAVVQEFMDAVTADRNAVLEALRAPAPAPAVPKTETPGSAGLWRQAARAESERAALHSQVVARLNSRALVTRYQTEEYPYLGVATADWRTSEHPEAGIVNPIDPALSPDDKVDALRQLSDENVPLVERVLARLKEQMDLDGKWSIKLPERVQAKASRPSIRAEKPWHDVEHIRDGLRFKVKLQRFDQVPAIMKALLDNGIEVVKLDTKKMFAPKEWGWRFVAWDLRMPNGQLVEFYAPVPELDHKDVKGPNHLLFEKWRNVPAESIAADAAMAAGQAADIRESKTRYDAAFAAAMNRMGYADLSAAEASWNKLVALLGSMMRVKRSANSAALNAPAGTGRQTLSMDLMAPAGPGSQAKTTPSSSSNTSGSFFTPDNGTDPAGFNETSRLFSRKVIPDSTPDLLNLWAETLPAPVKASKPAFARAAKKELPPAVLPQTNESFGDLFDFAQAPGYAGGNGPEADTSAGSSEQPGAKAKADRKPKRAKGVSGDLFDFDFTGQTGEQSGGDGAGGLGDAGVTDGGGSDGVPEPTAGGKTDADTGSAKGDQSGRAALPPVVPEPEEPEDRNHRIDPASDVAPKGRAAKIEANFAAMAMIRKLEEEGRNPNADERRVLEAYTGWGSIKEGFNTVKAEKYRQLQETFERQRAYMEARKRSWETSVTPSWRQLAEASGVEENRKILAWHDTYGALHERLKKELTKKQFDAAAKSVRNAHFTTPAIIGAMWKMVDRLGFKGGRAMEPGGGIGHFIGVQPEGSASRTRWEATELDDVTAKILAKLYPQARVNSKMPAPGREVVGMGFQDARIPNNSLDLFISNVPFAKEGPGKSKSEFGMQFNLHNYFFARALSKVKPGGLVAFITTHNTMDAGRAQREYLNKHGELVAAIRLPDDAFMENAGTEVVTDIIIIRKPDGRSVMPPESWVGLVEVGRDNVISTRPKDGPEYRREPIKLHDWLAGIDGEWNPADPDLARVWEVWRAAGRPKSGAKWKAVEEGVGGTRAETVVFSAPIRINEYFARHPENILGKSALEGTMYGPGQYTVKANGDLEAQLNAAADRLPQDIMGETQTTGWEAVSAERDDKVDSYVERDGKIYQVSKEGLEPVDWNELPTMDDTTKRAAKRKTTIFRQWVKLRDAAVALVKLEGDPRADDAELDAARQDLNRVYDTTVGKFGAIGARRSNYRFLEDDPQFPLLEALEDEVREVGRDGKATYRYKKTDIFRRRLIPPLEAPTTAASIEEAISVSLAWQGDVNPLYVADLLKITVPEARRQLIESGKVFENPASGLLESADEYLSGDVGGKLKAAEAAALDSLDYRRNVDALRNALPPRKAISETNVQIGERWVPGVVYGEFLKSLGVSDASVIYSPMLNRFEIKGRGGAEQWTVGNWYPYETLDALLNNGELVVKQYDRGNGFVVDQELTASLQSKAEEMKDAFAQFVRTSEVEVQDPDFEGEAISVPELTEREFNDKVNNIVPPTYVGDWVTLPGQSGVIWLKPFRKAVLARFLTQGRGMMAHGVGSGKTFNQIALAMELRRLGKARKPVIVVQNSTINQFAASFRKAYPGARLLVSTPRSYSAQRRAQFTSRMATGDWDAIILTHSNLDLIGNSAESVEAYFAKELEELDAAIVAAEGDDTQSALQAARDKLAEARLKLLAKLEARQDGVLEWEDMGVDALIVDEAHVYKNAPVVTNRGRDVKNIPTTGAGSQRAISMMLKAKAVRDRNKGKGVFFATGTPISNTMAEAYIMLRFIAPDMLEANGMRNFDDFAAQYGTVVSNAEATWKGEVKIIDRFAKFTHGPQFINLIRSVFDVAMGNESLGIDVPSVKGGKPRSVTVKATAANQAFNQWVVNDVVKAWDAVSRKDIEENPWIGAVPIMTMQAGIAAALDPRMIHDNAPDDPNSKVNTAIKDVLRIYKEGQEKKTTQVMFSDLFNPFNMDLLASFAGHPFADLGANPGKFNIGEDIKQKLIASGIPEGEIMVVTDQKDEKLTAIFDKVNSGEIRVIIGSTSRLGVGVNIQERLAAAHHLMPPRDFKPAMMEQRNGRIIRQGNLHAEWRDIAFTDVVEAASGKRFNDSSAFKRAASAREWLKDNDTDGSIRKRADSAAEVYAVEIIEYGVERSLDSAVYSMMAAKQGMIAQALTGEGVGDEFEDPTDEIQMNMAEQAANLMGDPAMIRLVWVERALKKLRNLYNGFQRIEGSRAAELRSSQRYLQLNDESLPKLEAAEKKFGGLFKANEGKAVWEFGGNKVDMSDPKARLVAPLDLWLADTVATAQLQGQKAAHTSFRVNGVEVFLAVEGDSEDSIRGFVSVESAESQNGRFFNGGAAQMNLSLRALIDSIGEAPARTRAESEHYRQRIAELMELRENRKEFPQLAEMRALEAEKAALDARIAAPAPNTNTALAEARQRLRENLQRAASHAADVAAWAAERYRIIAAENAAADKEGEERFDYESASHLRSRRMVPAPLSESGGRGQESSSPSRSVPNGQGEQGTGGPAVNEQSPAPADGAELRSRSFSSMLRGAGIDVEKLDADMALAALEEAAGEGFTVGRPDLALGAGVGPDNWANSAVRAVHEQHAPEPETQDQWRDAGAALLQDDFRGTVNEIRRRGLAGETLTPELTAAAKLFIESEGRRKMTPQRVRSLQQFVNSYVMTGTEAAHALGSRVDPWKGPEERHREYLVKVVMGPTQEQRARQHAAKEKRRQANENDDSKAREAAEAELRKVAEEMQARLTSIEAEFARQGWTLDDLFSGGVKMFMQNSPAAKAAVAGMGSAARQKAAEMLREHKIQGDYRRVYKHIAKETGLTLPEVEKVHEAVQEKFREEMKRDLRARMAAAQKAREDAILKSQNVTGVRVDMDALLAMTPEQQEAELERMANEALAQTGWVPKEKLGKMTRRKRKPLFRPPPPRRQENTVDRDWLGRPVPRTSPATQSRLEGTTPPAWEGGTPGPGLNQRGRLDLGDLDADETFTGDAEEFGNFGTLWSDPAWEGDILVETGKDVGRPEVAAKAARMASVVDASGLDMLLEFWTAGLFSGMRTQMANFAGGLVGATWEYTVQRFSEMLVNSVVRDTRGARVGELKYALRGILPGVHRGIANAMRTWAGEGDYFKMDVLQGKFDDLARGAGIKGEGREPAISEQPLGQIGRILFGSRGEAVGLKADKLLNTLGNGAAKPIAAMLKATGMGRLGAWVEQDGRLNPVRGRVGRLSFRTLAFIDAVFKGVIGHMEAGAQAYRLAKARGLSGPEMERYINNQLGTPGSEAWKLAVQKAEDLLFQQALRDMFQIHGKTDEHGLPDGYSSSAKWQPVEASARTVEHLTWMLQKSSTGGGKIVRFLFPVIRAAYRIIGTATRKSVGSTLLATEELIHGGILKIRDGKAITETHPAFVKHVAESLTALGLYMVLRSFGEGDDDDDKKPILITGSPYRSQGERELQKRTAPAYGVRIFGEWFSYGRYEPVSGIVGNLVDILRTQKSGSTRKWDAIQDNLMGQMMDKTFMQGFKNLVESWQYKSKDETRAGNILERVRSFALKGAVPNLIRQGVASVDDTERDYKNAEWWYDALPLPGGAPERINLATGEPVKKTGNSVSRIFIPYLTRSDEAPHPADVALQKWHRSHPELDANDPRAPGLPQQVLRIDGKNVELGKNAWLYYQKRSATLARYAMPKSFPAVPQERDIARIKKVYDEARERAREEIKRWPADKLTR